MEQPKIKKVRPKEIRVTFKENEEYLYNFVKSKSSISAYIKELIQKDIDKSSSNDMSLKMIEELVLKIVDLSRDVDIEKKIKDKNEIQEDLSENIYDNQVVYENLNITIDEDEF